MKRLVSAVIIRSRALEAVLHCDGLSFDGSRIYEMPSTASQYRQGPRLGKRLRLGAAHYVNFHAAPDHFRDRNVPDFGDTAQPPEKWFR
jgi:hypothetical protein